MCFICSGMFGVRRAENPMWGVLTRRAAAARAGRAGGHAETANRGLGDKEAGRHYRNEILKIETTNELWAEDRIRFWDE